VGGDSGNAYGGGIFIGGSLGGLTPSLTVSNSSITGNHANGGSGGAGGSDGQGIGGGVYNLGTFLYDLATVIARNHASTGYDNLFTT
jgi:hypothetical protein